MLTSNYLVTEFGFKRKTKNKDKILVNDEYGITLKSLQDDSNSFVDINTSETYHWISDILTKFELVDIERDSKRFHDGLPECNLRQGNFDDVYTENNQTDGFFISQEKAKKILKSLFNRLLCQPLMCSSEEDNFNYYIKETKYEFRQSESNIVILTLYYNYKDRSSYHDFWMTHDIYDFDKNIFHINRRLGVNVPLDLIIQKFFK